MFLIVKAHIQWRESSDFFFSKSKGAGWKLQDFHLQPHNLNPVQSPVHLPQGGLPPEEGHKMCNHFLLTVQQFYLKKNATASVNAYICYFATHEATKGSALRLCENFVSPNSWLDISVETREPGRFVFWARASSLQYQDSDCGPPVSRWTKSKTMLKKEEHIHTSTATFVWEKLFYITLKISSENIALLKSWEEASKVYFSIFDESVFLLLCDGNVKLIHVWVTQCFALLR